jgi:hypothetical protein
MKKAAFYLDGGIGLYFGYSDGYTWNGWSTPWFTKTAIKRILLTEQINGERFEWDGDTLINYIDGEKPCVVESITYNGKTLYQLGNGWVWDTDEIINVI